MPDITLCRTKNCPLADKCYRKLASKSYFQTYAEFHYDADKKMCKYFYPAIKEKSDSAKN